MVWRYRPQCRTQRPSSGQFRKFNRSFLVIISVSKNVLVFSYKGLRSSLRLVLQQLQAPWTSWHLLRRPWILSGILRIFAMQDLWVSFLCHSLIEMKFIFFFFFFISVANWGYHRQGSCQAGLGATITPVRRLPLSFFDKIFWEKRKKLLISSISSPTPVRVWSLKRNFLFFYFPSAQEKKRRLFVHTQKPIEVQRIWLIPPYCIQEFKYFFFFVRAFASERIFLGGNGGSSRLLYHRYMLMCLFRLTAVVFYMLAMTDVSIY